MTCTLLGWRQVCTPRGSVWLLAAVHVRPSSRLAMNAWLELSESGVQCSFQLLTGAAYGNLTTVRSLLPTASSASLYKVWLGVGISGGFIASCLLFLACMECARWYRYKRALTLVPTSPADSRAHDGKRRDVPSRAGRNNSLKPRQPSLGRAPSGSDLAGRGRSAAGLTAVAPLPDGHDSLSPSMRRR